MISGRPNRLWQMEVSDTTVGKPFVVTAGSWLDEMPSLTMGSDGHARLVYYGDTGVKWPGSSTKYSSRVFYKDLAVEPKANDRTGTTSRWTARMPRSHPIARSRARTPRSL
jgi:hypothetical protein